MARQSQEPPVTTPLRLQFEAPLRFLFETSAISHVGTFPIHWYLDNPTMSCSGRHVFDQIMSNEVFSIQFIFTIYTKPTCEKAEVCVLSVYFLSVFSCVFCVNVQCLFSVSCPAVFCLSFSVCFDVFLCVLSFSVFSRRVVFWSFLSVCILFLCFLSACSLYVFSLYVFSLCVFLCVCSLCVCVCVCLCVKVCFLCVFPCACFHCVVL